MSSSYQTLGDVFIEIRAIVEKDTVTLPDAILLRFANKRYLEMVRHLIGLNEDLYAEISYADLVADQREYILPQDNTDNDPGYGGGLIKLQRVEITYNASSWYLASPISLQEFTGPTITDADLNKQATQTAPRYWFKDRSVWISPVPASTDVVTADNAGIRIYWIKRPYEMTATTDVPDLPKDFIGILGEGILYDVFRKFGRFTEARDAKQNWVSGIGVMRDQEKSPDPEQPFILKAKFKNYK